MKYILCTTKKGTSWSVFSWLSFHIVNLGSGQIQVEITNGRGTHCSQEYTHQPTLDRSEDSFVCGISIGGKKVESVERRLKPG